MAHCYYDHARMAMQYDPLTDTKQGDCIPGCIRVDSSQYPHAALLRIPVYHHKRAGCATVTELCELVDSMINGVPPQRRIPSWW